MAFEPRPRWADIVDDDDVWQTPEAANKVQETVLRLRGGGDFDEDEMDLADMIEQEEVVAAGGEVTPSRYALAAGRLIQTTPADRQPPEHHPDARGSGEPPPPGPGPVLPPPAVFGPLPLVEEQEHTTAANAILYTFRSGPVRATLERPSVELWDGHADAFQQVEGWKDIKYNKWVLFSFLPHADAAAVLAQLRYSNYSLYGVNVRVRADGTLLHTALCERQDPRKGKCVQPADCTVTSVHVLKIRGQKGGAADTVVSVCRAWLASGQDTMANFCVRARTQDQPLTWRDLEKAWEPLTPDEAEALILDAKGRLKGKRARGPEDKVIADMGPDVLRRKKEAVHATPSYVQYADDPDLLPLEQFQNLDRVLVHQWDVLNGVVVTYPLLSWLEGGHYAMRALILAGDSDHGKTALAKSLLAEVARRMQPEDVIPRPYNLVLQTVEGLGLVNTVKWCKEWVGILLDEVRPGKVRGTRDGMSVDEVKKLCGVNMQAGLDARHHDIMLSKNQPRVFTANALNPSEWHEVLPADLYRTSDAVRLCMSPDVKAIGKRVAWAVVTESVIPQALRDAYNSKRA